MGDKEKKIDIEHSKHPLVSYKDPTENTWAILKPVLDSKSSVQKLAWGNYIIRKLKFDFVSTEEIPPNSSKRIEDFYKQPFVDMLILDGDEDSKDTKAETRKLANEWISKKGDNPWLVIVVQKSLHQSKIFKYQLAEKLRSDVQAHLKSHICSIRINEGQNDEQWIDLGNKLKELFIESLTKKVDKLKSSIVVPSDSAPISPDEFRTLFKRKECLANIYRKINLYDLSLLEYIDLEKIFYQYMKKTKRMDTCFSASKFSDSSYARLTGDNVLEYELLDAGKVSSFDFHQYLVANQFNLLQDLSMYKLALMRVSSFIADVRKYLTSQANRDNPMIVDAWIFNAGFTISNFCSFFISGSKSDNSQAESHLKVAAAALQARNELRRFGISRGLLDKSAIDVFSMIKSALKAIESDLDAADDEDGSGSGSSNTSSENAQPSPSTSPSTTPAQLSIKDPLSTEEPFTIEERGTDCNAYTGDPDTKYIENAIKEYMAATHSQIPSAGPLHASTPQLQQDRGQSQQPMQSVQQLSSSKRMTFNFKNRTTHSFEPSKGELQKSASPTVPSSGGSSSSSGNSDDNQLKSVRRTATTTSISASSSAGTRHSPHGSLTSSVSLSSSVSASSSTSPALPGPIHESTESSEMLAIEHFYASLPKPMPPKEDDDLSRFSDNQMLMGFLKSEEEFDRIFIDLSEKALKSYKLAHRPRAALNIFCDVALHYFARRKWPEAEAIFAFITETLKRWKTFDNVFLILLSYTQYKNKNYEGFINTCFKILASTNITGDDEKIKYLKKMLIVARKNLTSKLKKIDSSLAHFSPLFDDDSARKKEVIVGENVEYECMVENKVPCDLCVDKIEMVFATKEEPKAKFKARACLKDGGETQICLKPGKDNTLKFSGVSSLSGAFVLDYFAITVGKLVVKRKFKGEQSVSVIVQTTPPAAAFIATFPKWLPRDKEQPQHDVKFIIKPNKDKLSDVRIELSTDALFKESKLSDSDGAKIKIGKGGVVRLEKEIDSDSGIVLTAPLDYTKLKKSNEISARFFFRTSLSGGVCMFTQKTDIKVSDPFSFTSWQAPFRGDSILVQMQLQSKAAVPLKIVGCRVAPADSTAFEGPIYSLGTTSDNGEGKELGSVYRVEDGFADVVPSEGSVVMPRRMFGTAYVFEKPPKFTETWTFSVKYEFVPFRTSDGAEPETLTRTFSSQFNMGFFSPEYTATLSFPKMVTIGEMFNMVIRVTPSSSSLSTTITNGDDDDDDDDVEVSKGDQKKKKKKSRSKSKSKSMVLRVLLPVPGQYVQQGYSRRVIEFEDDREQTFRVGFIPLQVGELLVPTVEITDEGSEFNKARILSEHPTIHSLSSSQFFMSCERVAVARPQNRMKPFLKDNKPLNVVWVHTPAGAERVADPDFSQKIGSAVNKLFGQQISLDIVHYTYTEWMACRSTVMEEKYFHKVIVDGESRLVSRVLLFLRQRERYLDTPIVIYTDDTQRCWSEFSQIPNVHAIYNSDQLFDILIDNPFAKNTAGARDPSNGIVSPRGDSEGKFSHRHTKSISFIKPPKKN